MVEAGQRARSAVAAMRMTARKRENMADGRLRYHDEKG
jgi:hypothetical protein